MTIFNGFSTSGLFHLREKTDFKHLLCSYEFWEKTAKQNTALQLPVFSLRAEGKDRGKRPEGPMVCRC